MFKINRRRKVLAKRKAATPLSSVLSTKIKKPNNLAQQQSPSVQYTGQTRNDSTTVQNTLNNYQVVSQTVGSALCDKNDDKTFVGVGGCNPSAVSSIVCNANDAHKQTNSHMPATLSMPNDVMGLGSQATLNLQNIMCPVNLPMLAAPIRRVADLDLYANAQKQYIVEEKYDGERMLLLVNKVNSDDDTASTSSSLFFPKLANIQRCYSRTLKQHAHFKYRVQFKTNAKMTSCILDGELVYIDDSVVPARLVPICDTGNRMALKQRYYVFDIQMLNNINVMNLDLMARKHLLQILIEPTEQCHLSPFTIVPESSAELLEHFKNVVSPNLESTAIGCEGLMLKNSTIAYVPDSRKYWFKMKSLHLQEHKDEYELYAHCFLRDKNNIYNILDCGYYYYSNDDALDDGGDAARKQHFKHIVYVSSGINNANRTRLQLMLKQDQTVSAEATADNKSSTPPNTDDDDNAKTTTAVSGGGGNGTEFQTRVIVTIIADKITANGHLRHPSFKQIRTDLTSIDVSAFEKIK